MKKHFDGKVPCPQAFLSSCLLLLVAEREGHGYEIAERLRIFGFDHDDPSPVYSELRRLKDAHLLDSAFDEPAAGPARRVYRLTPAGEETLARCCVSLVGLSGRVQAYVERCHEMMHR